MDVGGKPVGQATRHLWEGKRHFTCLWGAMFRRPAAVTHRGVGSGASDSSSVAAVSDHADWLAGRPGAWMRTYVRQVAIADFSAAIVAAIAAVGVRFGAHPNERELI